MVVILLGLWMASGLIKSDENKNDSVEAADTLMSVQVMAARVQTMDRMVELQGQLEPRRHLLLKAQTSGVIEQFLVTKGQRIRTGDVIAQLDQGDRQNTLAEARARVKLARSEQQAAATMRQQRLQSQLQLEQAEAALETALAQLTRIELDIEHTRITAPFDAVVKDLPLDIGALVERGDIVTELVDDSAFDVSAQAAQQTLTQLTIGQRVSIKLITGQTLEGILTFISPVADTQTRSFRVEARVQNTDGTIAAGVSSTISIPVEQVEAVFISPSTLSLGDNGELGVKTVDDTNRVRFLPIELISTSLDGAWVTGIESGSRVITLGQGFVSVGETVDPQPASMQEQTSVTQNTPAISRS